MQEHDAHVLLAPRLDRSLIVAETYQTAAVDGSEGNRGWYIGKWGRGWWVEWLLCGRWAESKLPGFVEAEAEELWRVEKLNHNLTRISYLSHLAHCTTAPPPTTRTLRLQLPQTANRSTANFDKPKPIQEQQDKKTFVPSGDSNAPREVIVEEIDRRQTGL